MIFLCIILLVVGIDLTTKAWASRNLMLNEKKELVKNHFYLWHIKNEGVAYNSFVGYMKWIIAISAGSMMLFAVDLIRNVKQKKHPWQCFFMSLLLGGALGNLLERMKFGRVTDFLYWKGRNKPIFNMADVFVLIGGVFLVLSSIFSKEN